MIYADYNATTPILPAVKSAIVASLDTAWANPSSTYRIGNVAKCAIDKARQQVADLIGTAPDSVVFTSGATEANNTAILSKIATTQNESHVIVSNVEHSSVLELARTIRKRGVSVSEIQVDSEGFINLAELEKLIREETVLISLMWANNETGVLWPVQEIGAICHKHGVAFHCDAVQAVGKVPFEFSNLSIDYLTVSGHKIGGPKGVGALIIREGVDFQPMLFGGKQEQGRRGGTESVPLIVGFGEACSFANEAGLPTSMQLSHIRDHFETLILKNIDGSYRNGSITHRLPNTSNLGIKEIDSDALVTFCDSRGICISSGSACLESAITPSHVIYAMTRSYERAEESFRVSFGYESSVEDATMIAKVIAEYAQLHR